MTDSDAWITTPDGWTILPPPYLRGAEPVQVLLATAAEAVRAANHDRSGPEFPSVLGYRATELADILRKLDQLTARLALEAGRLAERPMYHDGGGDPVETARAADIQLGLVRDGVQIALEHADAAHTHLSRLGAADPGDG